MSPEGCHEIRAFGHRRGQDGWGALLLRAEMRQSIMIENLAWISYTGTMKIEAIADMASYTASNDPQNRSQMPRECCKVLHEGQDNPSRLRSLMGLFTLSQSDIVRATGYSRTSVSRLISGEINASPAFWAKLNSRLLDLLNRTGSWCTVFKVALATR